MDYRIELLGELMVIGPKGTVTLSPGPARLVAYLACGGAGSRYAMAENHWPGLADGRAPANLRSALWRLHRLCPGLLHVTSLRAGLARGVHVDLHAATDVARAVIDGGVDADALALDPGALTLDVLPTWPDEWAEIERERYRQLRLHALESLARTLLGDGRFGAAIDMVSVAIRAEPLRESAHAVLIEAHLGEGNRVEAVRAYEACSRMLADELGVVPGPRLRRILGDLQPAGSGAARSGKSVAVSTAG